MGVAMVVSCLVFFKFACIHVPGALSRIFSVPLYGESPSTGLFVLCALAFISIGEKTDLP